MHWLELPRINHSRQGRVVFLRIHPLGQGHLQCTRAPEFRESRTVIDELALLTLSNLAKGDLGDLEYVEACCAYDSLKL